MSNAEQGALQIKRLGVRALRVGYTELYRHQIDPQSTRISHSVIIVNSHGNKHPVLFSPTLDAVKDLCTTVRCPSRQPV